MQKIVSFIPNLFTLGNLLCGCLAIIYASNRQFDWSAYMVFLAAFLDFFDGFLARLLKVSSELGKQLDSLADMVSFGVAPGIMMFELLSINEIAMHDSYLVLHDFKYINYVALLIPLFSGYRLAKFNIDTKQTNGFIGLPTPANALFFMSIGWIFIYYTTHLRYEENLYEGLEHKFSPFEFYYLYLSSNPYFLISLIVLFSFLLISPLKLIALKFKNFGWADNKIRYIFLVICAVLLVLFQFVAIPFIVILYILTSVVNNIFKLTV